jgi:hypothetical protein
VVDGVPHIVYATFPTVENHTYPYARWDGQRRPDERVTTAGSSFNPDRAVPELHYSDGIALDPTDLAVICPARSR